MTIEIIEGEDTGIYKFDRVKPTGTASTAEYFRQLTAALSEAWDFDLQLSRIEDHAQTILREAGCDEWSVPRGAPGIVQDARALLFDIAGIKDDLAKGRIGKTLLVRAMRLGAMAERLAVRPFEPHALRGRRVLEGAKAGHTAVYGGEAQKSRERARVLGRWDKVRTENPTWTDGAVHDEVAKFLGISTRTVRRYRSRAS